MAKIKVKGYEFESVLVKDSFSRRAVQFANNIIKSLGKIGIIPDDIDLKLEPNVMKKAPAFVAKISLSGQPRLKSMISA